MEPVGAGEKLVGKVVMAEEFYQALELGRIFRSDIGRLADLMLRVKDTADLLVHSFAAEARIDKDRTDDEPSRLQQI